MQYIKCRRDDGSKVLREVLPAPAFRHVKHLFAGAFKLLDRIATRVNYGQLISANIHPITG